MTYVTDVMRVEMSLPVHIMLAVLLSGANCADPGPFSSSKLDFYQWVEEWNKHRAKTSDPVFAKSYKVFNETKALLMEACKDALFGIYPQKRETSILKRIERVHKDMVTPYVSTDNPDPRKIGIIAYYLIQHLVDTNTIIVPEDSAFGLALNHMLPALSPQTDAGEQEISDYDNLNASAQKQVRKILQHLQNEGYYLGIPIPDY